MLLVGSFVLISILIFNHHIEHNLLHKSTHLSPATLIKFNQCVSLKIPNMATWVILSEVKLKNLQFCYDHSDRRKAVAIICSRRDEETFDFRENQLLK